MTDATVLRAKTPEDLLALVPGLIGFHPVESLVLLTLGGAAANPFHARMDLPDDPVELEGAAAYLAGVVRQHGVRRVAVVVYSGDAGLAEAIVTALDEQLHAPDGATAEIECCVRADGQRYWVLGADGVDDVDSDGTAYDVGAHPLLAQAVYSGTVVHGSRAELAATLEPVDPDELADVARIADGVAVRLARSLRLAQTAPRGRTVRRRHELELEARWVRHRVRRALDGALPLDRHDAARLCVLISASVDVRDVAWAEMSHATAGAHEDLWRDLVRRVPEDIRAAPAALLGFAAWLGGHGALAWCAVDVARRADPDYSLAKLLSDMLADAVPPSAYSPIPKGILRLLPDTS